MYIKIIGTKPEISKETKNYLGKNQAACLVSSNNTSILVNLGEDILKTLNKSELDSITHVLVTHEHLQSIGGIAKLDMYLEDSNKMVPIYGPESVLKTIELRHSLRNFVCHPIHSNKTYNIEGIFVKPIKVFHTPNSTTFAYNFNGVFFYASNMGPVIRKVDLKYATNNILAVLDGQYWNYQVLSDNHITVSKHLTHIFTLNNKYTLFTGMGNQWPSLELSDKVLGLRLRKYQKENKKCKIKEIRTAKEGEKFSINLPELIARRRSRNKKIDIFSRK